MPAKPPVPRRSASCNDLEVLPRRNDLSPTSVCDNNLRLRKEDTATRIATLATLRLSATTVYDPATNEPLLRDLWRLSFGKDDFLACSPRWRLLGFQGDDPTTDFRGPGLMGLEHLLDLVKSGMAPLATTGFPVAVASINATGVLQACHNPNLRTTAPPNPRPLHPHTGVLRPQPQPASGLSPRRYTAHAARLALSRRARAAAGAAGGTRPAHGAPLVHAAAADADGLSKRAGAGGGRPACGARCAVGVLARLIRQRRRRRMRLEGRLLRPPAPRAAGARRPRCLARHAARGGGRQ